MFARPRDLFRVSVVLFTNTELALGLSPGAWPLGTCNSCTPLSGTFLPANTDGGDTELFWLVLKPK